MREPMSRRNTGSSRSPRLRGYTDLLAWSQEHGGLGASDAHRLGTLAAESPQDAAAAFAAAKELHALLSAILNGLADGADLRPGALAELNALRLRIVPRRSLVEGPECFEWAWPAERGDDLGGPLWTVVLSATDLLTSPLCRKVKRCANTSCNVLFVAFTSGSPRRWCDGRSCGAAVRARRHYRRVRKRAKDA